MKRPGYYTSACCLGLSFFLFNSCSFLSSGGHDWPMWRYDANRSAHSPEQLPDDLQLLWVREYPRLVQTWDDPLNQDLMQYDKVYEPVVHRGILFLVSNASDCVIALDAEDGSELWRYYVDGPVRFPAVAAEGKVFFTSDDGNLYCLDAEIGVLKWRFRGAPDERDILGNERLISTWPARGGPVYNDGLVYFGAGIWPFMGVFVFAVDAETGDLVWKNDSSGPRYMLQPHNSPAYAGVAPQGHLVVAGDNLLVPCGRSVPACFDLKTGEFKYYRLAENGKTGGAFVAAKGDFFVNYHRDSVVSLYRLSDGESVIRRFGKVPVLTEDRLFCRGDAVTAFDYGNIRKTAVKDSIVFDRETDSIKVVEEEQWVLDPLWRVELDASAALIKAGDKLFAGGKGVVSAVTLPGWSSEPELVWQTEVEGTASRIIAADRKLFVVTLEGRIYAFGGGQATQPVLHPLLPEKTEIDNEFLAYARAIITSTGVDDGYCLFYGANGDLIEALLRSSNLRVVAVESDPEAVDRLRKRFDLAGFHGRRFSVKPRGSFDFRPPPYFASLVVIEDLENLPEEQWEGFFEQVYQGLRPFGGTVYIGANGDTAESLGERLLAMGLENAEVRRVQHDADLLMGVKHAREQFELDDLSDDLAAELERVSGSLRSEGHLLLVRAGALAGSGDWTHQYGDVANTVKSDDQLVRLPLGVLWFGGSSNTDVLPRHGHGPPEQVVAGRLFIEGMKSLSARDVYTGRVLWKREFSRLDTDGIYYDETYKDTPLDTAYNQVHIPGANARGTNFVATEDKIYLLLKNSCVVLDPATGKTLDEFVLPPERPEDEPPEWAYIGVYGDYLIGGAGFARYLDHLDLDELDPRMKTRLNSFYNFDITASRRLVVMNRHTGRVLWTRRANLGFWHNAIAVAEGTIFCIDRLAPSVAEALKQRPGRYRFAPPELLALRIRDGTPRWRSQRGVFGTWLSCSEENGLLIQAGRSSRDMLRGEPSGLSVHRTRDGDVLWEKDISDGGPYILHGRTIITDRTAFDMLTGEQRMRVDPLTGEETPWVFRRDYGCNYIVGSENLLTFRSAAAGFLDLQNDGGTGTFGGFRSSCTSNLIAANGILNAPDYTRTCSCSYQNQTSLGLVHMPELDLWTTYYAQPRSVSFVDTDIPVLITDPELNPQFANSAFMGLFGLSEDTEVSTMSLADLFESSERFGKVAAGLERLRNWTGILDIRKADGASQEVHLMARVLSDEFFSPAAAILLFADSNESAVAFLDLAGELTHVDDTFLNLWTFGDVEEALTVSFEQLFEEKEKALSIMNGWGQGENWAGRLTAVKTDGSRSDVHVITHVVSDSSGAAISPVITCFDVSDRKVLEAEASKLVKELGAGVDLKYFMTRRAPIKRVGINFGAPGDRKDEGGTLWLEWPTNEGPSPRVQLDVSPVDPELFTHHSSWVRNPGLGWVAASGIQGVSEIKVWLADKGQATTANNYEVKFYFVEPDDDAPGSRVFDVSLQGDVVLSGFDIAEEAGGSRNLVVKTIKDVRVEDALTIEFTASEGSPKEPLICGVEIVSQQQEG